MQERVFLKQIVQKQPETETLDLAPQLYYYWIDKDTRAFKVRSVLVLTSSRSAFRR